MELGIILGTIFKAFVFFIVSGITVITIGEMVKSNALALVLLFSFLFVYAFLFYGDAGVVMLILASLFGLPIFFRG